jgi:hypothetical protein
LVFLVSYLALTSESFDCVVRTRERQLDREVARAGANVPVAGSAVLKEILFGHWPIGNYIFADRVIDVSAHRAWSWENRMFNLMVGRT